jgi:hypothetical protein
MIPGPDITASMIVNIGASSPLTFNVFSSSPLVFNDPEVMLPYPTLHTEPFPQSKPSLPLSPLGGMCGEIQETLSDRNNGQYENPRSSEPFYLLGLAQGEINPLDQLKLFGPSRPGTPIEWDGKDRLHSDTLEKLRATQPISQEVYKTMVFETISNFIPEEHC